MNLMLPFGSKIVVDPGVIVLLLVLPSIVTVSATASTPAGTFAIANDQVTGGGDLAPGVGRTVQVIFAPAAAGTFTGTLTVSGSNLAPVVFPII